MANRDFAITDTHHPNVIELAERWWVPALRGLAAIAFGVATFVVPGLTLFFLITLFAAYAVVDGIINLAMAVRGRRAGRAWGWLVFEGLVSIAAGVLAFLWPGITAIVFLFVIAAWAVVTGVAEIAAAIRLRKQIRNEWFLGFAGVLSVALGVLLFLFPGAGALAMVIWIGVYAILFGVTMLALAFKLRSWKRTSGRPMPRGGMPTPA
jgi:uncharacterized membrane protein HdeD (DUF308 family)